MVFRGCMNSTCEYYHKKEKKKRDRRERETLHKGQHISVLKTLKNFINQLSLV